jgi:hypothetical protein
VVIIDHISSTGGLDALCLERKATVERCRPVAEHLRRNGTWWAPTWVRKPYGSYGNGPRSQPLLARFEQFISSFWADSAPHNGSHNYLRGDTTDTTPLTASGGSSILDSLGFMYVVQRAGLPTLAATDAGMPVLRTVTPGFSLHAELALYAAEGMTPLEALQTATLNPAKMLHGTDSLGTVTQGKLADLILLDANPLDDITNTTTIRAVVANGRYFDRTALDELLIKAKQNP